MGWVGGEWRTTTFFPLMGGVISTLSQVRPSVRPSDRPLVRPAHVKITREENGFGPPFPIAALSAINRRFFGPREARRGSEATTTSAQLGSAQMGPFPVKVTHFSLGKHTYITNSFNSLLCVKCEVRMSLYNFSMQKGFAKSGRAPQFPSMLRLSLLSSSLPFSKPRHPPVPQRSIQNV